MSEPFTVRSVRPRKVKSLPLLPIITVSDDQVMIARTGVVYPRHSLPVILVAEPPSLVVVENHAAMVKDLDTIFRAIPGNTGWQFKATAVNRDLYKPDGTMARIKRVDTIISFFGWTRTRPNRSKYHHPLDPITFIKQSPNELRPPGPRLLQLLEWAEDVREWCLENKLTLRSTSGGLAAQLLRDERFYPNPRRKVPRATNDSVRAALPGNHYRLFVRERETVHAMYLDMRSAHHWCAASGIKFPHSDRLYARGRFHGENVDAWCKHGSSRQSQVLSEHGLLKVWLSAPHRKPGVHVPPYMEKQGTFLAYVYSNELPLIASLGGRIESVVAAWTSRQIDPGLPLYARWARAQLTATNDVRRIWMKATLLATYGILATRPRPQAFGFARAKGGQERAYPTTRGPLHVHARETGPCEPPTVNVIHRGMIEAEQRLQVIQLANELESGNCPVLAIYADSIFIQAKSPLPLLPEPWIVKEELTQLQFFTPTAFQSRELTKLPGIPRDDMFRVRLRENAHAALATNAGREYYSTRRGGIGPPHEQRRP